MLHSQYKPLRTLIAALSRHLSVQQILAQSTIEFERQRSDLRRQLQAKDTDLQRAQNAEDDLLDRLEQLEQDYQQYVSAEYITIDLD